jgi:hypothetical protein
LGDRLTATNHFLYAVRPSRGEARVDVGFRAARRVRLIPCTVVCIEDSLHEVFCFSDAEECAILLASGGYGNGLKQTASVLPVCEARAAEIITKESRLMPINFSCGRQRRGFCNLLDSGTCKADNEGDSGQLLNRLPSSPNEF